MLFAWLLKGRPTAEPASAEEAYLALVARRLLLAPGRRAACLAELGDHLAQRAATVPFQSLAEVVSRMGSPQLVATQLNAAAPWWQSRPSWRLYALALSLPVMFIAFAILTLAIVADRWPGQPIVQYVESIVRGGAFTAFNLAFLALLTLLARRWCVRPLQAAVPVCLLLILQMANTALTVVGNLLAVFVRGPDPDLLAVVFRFVVPDQILSWGVLVAPCALLLAMMRTEVPARWRLPALTLPLVLATLDGWFVHSHLMSPSEPAAMMVTFPIGAAVGVACIAMLMRRGAPQAD